MTGREQEGTAMRECQCEHESHEEGCGSTEELTTVRSSWGRYAICKQCRTDHPIPNEYLLPDGEFYVGESFHTGMSTSESEAYLAYLRGEAP